MSKTPRADEIKTTDDAISVLKEMPGVRSYHRYFDTKLAGDFAFQLAKHIKFKKAIEAARKEIGE